MTKTHSQPEFTVIKQNQANAKFFVASGGFNSPTPAGGPENSASHYDVNDADIDM